jgi:hypothetical protein
MTTGGSMVEFLALHRGKDIAWQGTPTGYTMPGYIELEYEIDGKKLRSLIPFHRLLGKQQL